MVGSNAAAGQRVSFGRIDRDRPASASGRRTIGWSLAAVGAVIALWDWLPGLAILVLWLGWTYLPRAHNLIVLPLAFTYQWLQVTVGVFYYGLTKRISPQVGTLDYHRIVTVELIGLVVLVAGILVGTRMVRARLYQSQRELGLTPRHLLGAYVVSAIAYGFLSVIAWRFPALTQLILAFSFFRFAVFYVLLRSLVIPNPRWLVFAFFLLVEVVLNSTAFFADFRQPLAMAILVLVEVRGRTRLRRKLQPNFGLALVAILTVLSGLLWTGVKGDYRAALRSNRIETRADKIHYVANLSNAWLNDPSAWPSTADQFVDRLWQIYFPALALNRVPSVVPHTNGVLLGDAVSRVVMPRLFFPDKPGMINDSEKVRLFGGVYVLGAERRTTFAFGYTAESYVDFGIPLMYLPILLYGLAVGATLRWLFQSLIHREIAVSVTAVLAWLSLHSLESSWAFMVGQAVALSLVLGITALLVDKALARQDGGQQTGAAGRRRPAYSR